MHVESMCSRFCGCVVIGSVLFFIHNAGSQVVTLFLMSTRSDSDNDDDFRDLYKEYTGPMGSSSVSVPDKASTKKRSHDDSDEDGGPADPNAVPTDFTSREAKVWEAKSKATERNWKKKKEEEMICKLCGDSGHFTQGCPSTLGANRKSQDFFQRVPAKDSRVRSIFTEKVIQKIEKDIGCKIKMDEKFLIVSGKDRLILAKGIDAVHGMINQEGDQRGSSSCRSRSRSPERSPPVARSRHYSSQRSHTGQPNASQFQQRFGRAEKIVEDHVHDDSQKMTKGSPQAYGNDRARGPSRHSKSPAHSSYRGNSYNSYDDRSQNVSGYNRTDGWDSEKRALDMRSVGQFEAPSGPQTYEELELEYKREAMELGKIRDKEEDEENYKHREAIREMRESYLKKVSVARIAHAKLWEEFLQLDAQKFQQQSYQQQIHGQGFGAYRQQSYADFDGSSNHHFSESGLPVGSRNGYQDPMDTYSSRLPGGYNDLQRQRRENYGKAFTRY